jgi:hypothetical protein
VLCVLASSALGQRAFVRFTDDALILPAFSDSNSPVHWNGDQFTVFQSVGVTTAARGQSQFDPAMTSEQVFIDHGGQSPLWIESTYLDPDGVLFAWYHEENVVCDGTHSVPKIGALISYDGGSSFQDLGTVLEAPGPINCNAENGYFAGGHGDFTVLLDATGEYFYFYFGNYGGAAATQGVSVARMAYEDRWFPLGRVNKLYNGTFVEPGLGGRSTPIMPVTVGWETATTDAFWGPALHFNTYLNQYVMLLNRSCCDAGWPQEGVYISFNPDLGNPQGWTAPVKILVEGLATWYPQVIGIEPGTTDKVAGEVARLYLQGQSQYEIEFDLCGLTLPDGEPAPCKALEGLSGEPGPPVVEGPPPGDGDDNGEGEGGGDGDGTGSDLRKPKRLDGRHLRRQLPRPLARRHPVLAAPRQ